MSMFRETAPKDLSRTPFLQLRLQPLDQLLGQGPCWDQVRRMPAALVVNKKQQQQKKRVETIYEKNNKVTLSLMLEIIEVSRLVTSSAS